MKFELNDFYTVIRKEKDPELLSEATCAETHHYLKAFENKSYANWNWAAFLFAPIWMLYRRLYAPYCILMLISIMLSYVPNAFLLIGLFINVAVGVFADSIYIYFVKQESAWAFYEPWKYTIGCIDLPAFDSGRDGITYSIFFRT